AEALLANATLYLDMMGHIVVGWLWVRQAEAATRLLDGATGTRRDFLLGKLTACRYFFRYEMPAVRTTAGFLATMDKTTVEADPNTF
ncbi:MAG: acyl-CoA dehydrogenase C-terminal domain-containing protein, partial [Pseudomonadota bacterium]